VPRFLGVPLLLGKTRTFLRFLLFPVCFLSPPRFSVSAPTPARHHKTGSTLRLILTVCWVVHLFASLSPVSPTVSGVFFFFLVSSIEAGLGERPFFFPQRFDHYGLPPFFFAFAVHLVESAPDNTSHFLLDPIALSPVLHLCRALLSRELPCLSPLESIPF